MDPSSDSSGKYLVAPDAPSVNPQVAPTTMPAGPCRPNNPDSLMNYITSPSLTSKLAWLGRLSPDGQVVASGTNSQIEPRSDTYIPEPATALLWTAAALLTIGRKGKARRGLL